MPCLSQSSIDKLKDCDPRLVAIVHKAIGYCDFKVTCGYRDEATQNKLFAEGKSKTPYPQSKHNHFPSFAIDLTPIIDGKLIWGDPIGLTKEEYEAQMRQLYYFGGSILGISYVLNILVRWGGDWDTDTNIMEKQWNDLYHFELVT